jgi:dTDP-4-dehydrorhamnose reductase
MKVLVCGANGQLGAALQSRVPRGIEVLATTRQALDITDSAAVEATLGRERISLLINAAAYTDVEGAERSKEEAFRVNAEGPASLARACAATQARLLHVSTDFVFDGEKRVPYSTEDEPHPLSVYGASKLEGERRVMDILGANACIMRTSWLHSGRGANFVTKILDRMRSGGPVRVVTDEIGSPTSAYSLAEALWRSAERAISGVYHWSDAGIVTRFEFATAIADRAVGLGLLRSPPALQAALVADFKSAAVRPAYSVLDTQRTQAALDLHPRHWKDGLELTLHDLRTNQRDIE